MQSRTLNRAKLFLSFYSLKGYKEMVKKKERIVVKRPELSEDSYYELDWKIHQIKVGELIKIIYFDRFEFISLEGMVTAIDLENKKQIKIVDKVIAIDNIMKIEMECPQDVKDEINDFLEENGADDSLSSLYI